MIRYRRLPVVLVAVVLALACGDNASMRQQRSAPGASAPMDAAVSREMAPPPSESVAGGSAAKLYASVPEVQLTSAPMQPSASPGMIIRNGSASIQVDSLELGIAAVQKMATTFGGYLGNTSLSAGENQVRSATIELKIPSARFDAALAGLEPIGTVESVSSTAEDVGEEFVDITARVANAKRLEERLISLLATRAGKLEEVLAVERELARVREEIERYEGRIRFLKTRVATSTLAVTVHEKAPLVSVSPGENVIVEAFKNAWRNFVRFIAALIASLGVLIPLAAVGIVAWIGWRRIRRSGKL